MSKDPVNEFKQWAQNSANAEKTWPISSAITEFTYITSRCQ